MRLPVHDRAVGYHRVLGVEILLLERVLRRHGLVDVHAQARRLGDLPSTVAQTLFDVANDSMFTAELRTRPGSQAITYRDVASLARRFGVSYEAAVWRLKSLAHIGSGDTEALLARRDTASKYMRELGFEGLSEADRNNAPPEQELRGQLVRLAVEAFRQDEISRGRLMDIAKKLFSDPAILIEFAKATRTG